MTELRTPRWTNWAGNQSCDPSAVIKVRDVEAVQAVVRSVARRGGHVRVVGAGHSFTPLVCTDDVILDVSGLAGLTNVDERAKRATVRAGTTIAQLGEPLWGHGLSLRNQGDIDAQTIGGAVGTATHGSGLSLTSLSGALCGIEYVGADGELHQITDSNPEFAGFRTALGTLGIFTAVELQLAPAYELFERIEYWPFAEVLARWEEETSERRHFSFFWGPTPGSLELYGFDSAPPGMVDGCYVKIYDEAPRGALTSRGVGKRTAPAHLTYPSDFDLEFYELEYFAPYELAEPAIDSVREVMTRHPIQNFPLEVRTIAAEDGWLSPSYGVDSISISVSGSPGTDYWPFLRDVDAALQEFGGRPHWGKLHVFDRERLQSAYPRFEDFVDLRRSTDPHGLFLNEHTRNLVG